MISTAKTTRLCVHILVTASKKRDKIGDGNNRVHVIIYFNLGSYLFVRNASPNIYTQVGVMSHL